PSLLGDDVDGRGAIVDLMLRFDGGTQVHVEMQLVSHPAFRRARAVLLGARVLTATNKRRRIHIEQLCAALGIELDDSRRGRLQRTADDDLLTLPGEIAKNRAWPE